MRMCSEPAYKVALAALGQGMCPVMIPGHIAGQPAVHVHGFPADHFPVLTFGTDCERVRALAAMMLVAHRFAQSAGMTTEA